ncbi:MAG: hypothetical protein C4547_03605 [Phycisphaerales bacterium]|nr:MAG: hypothetical protein C4547_03605 [Phycisphaerales bacterium]
MRHRREVLRLTDDHFNNQSPDLNDDGVVVWGRGDFCANPWVGEIHMYVDGEITVLASNETQIQVPTVNNLGQVAWHAPFGVEIWQDGRLSTLERWTQGPILNDRGDMKLLRQRKYNEAWLRRIEDGRPVYYQLTDDTYSNVVGDLNDLGEVVWRFIYNPPRGDFGGGVRFLRRIRTSDMNGDLDVDLDDLGDLAGCLTGPGRVDWMCECRFGDVDHDGDVDLADVARFQNNFTGD